MDDADRAAEFADDPIEVGLRRIRSEEKRRSNQANIVFTECLNCYGESNQRFCCKECRDDYEMRESRK